MCDTVDERAAKNPSGRAAAVAATRNYGPDTVGGVVHSAVKGVEPVVGEFAAGTIGAHYKEPATQRILSLPATRENLRLMATSETRYWNQNAPEGLPRFVGSSMSAATRYGLLVANKEKSYKAGAEARCEMMKHPQGEQ